MVICLYRVPVGCGDWRMWFLKSIEVLVNRNVSWLSERARKTSLESMIHVWKENGGAFENKASESHVFITLYVLWLEFLFFHWKTGVLQIKLVQKEGLFGRLVSALTSEINDHKRLCMLQNNNLMVQIESYSLSKTVEVPYINPRYFLIIYFQWYEDQIWPTIVRVDISDLNEI